VPGFARRKEPELHVLTTIAYAAAAVVVIGWLAVSFLKPGALRRKLVWIAATGLFVALLSFFLNLLRRSIASDNEAGMIAFGFLSVMFTCSLLVSLVRTFRALAGKVDDAKSSATH
jgi:hypothetical protein